MIFSLLVSAVIAMLIAPLPGAVLDFCMAMNIAFSFLLVLTAVSLRDPEKFTTLPSVLLLATLFRFSLNVATTRMLLSDNDAPRIVSAFGEFVVQGDLLVGSVVFLIITLVQFIVISKGSERVAEVAARFTLDAMPGKQMAIDADIRAGVLNVAEAKERRRELQRESKLFGALDGAMKFVKGDAIAGIIITVVNIVAGILVGLTRHGLTIGEAVHRYAIFTIGDSLASQIPALLISVAAGLAVTKVGQGSSGSFSQEFREQLMGEPGVLGVTGILLLGISIFPGMPTTICFLIVLGVFAVLWLRRQEIERDTALQQQYRFQPRVLNRLLLCVSESARALLHKEGVLPNDIARCRQKIFEEQGVLIPEPEWQVANERAGNWFSLVHDGIVVSEKTVEPTMLSQELETPLTQHVLDTFSSVVLNHLEDYVDDTHTRVLLDLQMGTAEDLVVSLIPKVVSVTCLTKILSWLVEEKVSIRNIHRILQALGEKALVVGELLSHEAKQYALLQHVREALQKQISDAIRHGLGNGVWVLSPKLEDLFRRMVDAGVSPTGEFLENFRLALQARGVMAENRFFLVPREVRRQVFELTKRAGFAFTVLSAEELQQDWNVKIEGVIDCQEPQAVSV